ncbi:MAG: MotA/TolQ/ExbB proton channel family protein [Candidatus Binatia bacterium]|nr:MotA/TolQ/ExbB proton channel family protein [Candidatus Binatia bacterium]
MARDWWTLIQTGGLAMYPLLACSVVSLAVVLERGWALWSATRKARQLRQAVAAAVSEGAFAEVGSIVRRDSSMLAPLFRAAIAAAEARTDDSWRLLQNRHSATVRNLKRHLWLIGTIGSLAPFIGLFGTVLGIVRAFENMAATGSGGFAVVAAGISEALIATAAGLLIGVVSIFFYNAFNVRVASVANEWKEWAEEFAAELVRNRSQEGGLARVVQAR